MAYSNIKDPSEHFQAHTYTGTAGIHDVAGVALPPSDYLKRVFDAFAGFDKCSDPRIRLGRRRRRCDRVNH